MTALFLAAALVGISDPCAADGSISVSNYVEAVRRSGDVPVIVCRTASADDLERIVPSLDLLIMTGGEDVAPARYGEEPAPKLGRVNMTRDSYEWGLLSCAVRHGVPLYGTCRGQQVINVFFGGSLHQDLPSEYPFKSQESHRCRDIGLSPRDFVHKIFVSPDTRLAAICGAGAFDVNSVHHQAVERLAPGFRVAAKSPEGVVEAIECDWYPAAGVQFHPEVLVALNDDPLWTRFYARVKEFAGKRAPGPRPMQPIGVFDSGIGGLSVLERFLELDRFDNATGEMRPDGKPDFAGESFVYFGDQANMPYGRYDAAGKAEYLRELVVKDAQFVLGPLGHEPSKAVVIACNTATAYGLERVKAMARPGDSPVIGVVNAGVEGAIEAISGVRGPCAVGVMATPATISSGVYQRTLRGALAPSAEVEIASRGGIGLAEAVESGDAGMRECARTNIVALVEEYRASGGKSPIKAIILGCTHYPFVVDVFRDTLAKMREDRDYAALIAEDVVFVDPAVNTAIACYRTLRERGLLAPRDEARPKVSAFLSVGRNGPLSDAVKYGRELGEYESATRIVPMTAENMPPGSSALVRTMMPLSARELGF